jgi:EF hand
MAIGEKNVMKKVLILVAGFWLISMVAPSGAFAAKADGKKAKLIAKYDKNGNGIIDGDEMNAVRKDFAADPNGELKQFDTNGDGKLSDEEIAAIKPGSGKKGGEAKKAGGNKMAKLIAKYDKNGNGIIDGDEKDALRKDFAADPNGELKQFDLNSDGKLSDGEIAAIKPGAAKTGGGGKKAKATSETTSPSQEQKEK